VLGHLADDGVFVMELLGEFVEAGVVADEAENEGGEFAGVVAGAGEELGEVIDGPVSSDERDQAMHVATLDERADEADELLAIGLCFEPHAP
jgi:hypothetical protein